MSRPRRDLTKEQAPVPGYEGGWEPRWRVMWARQRVEAKGLTGLAALNEGFKAIYGSKRPPGSPPVAAQPRNAFADLFPSGTWVFPTQER